MTQPDLRWYSICSSHRDYDSSCPRCCVGTWVDEGDPEVIADRELWNRDRDAWRVRHSRENFLDQLVIRRE